MTTKNTKAKATAATTSYSAHGQTFSRAEALKIIWRQTHRDQKVGTRKGHQSLLVNRAGEGTCLVALDALTEEDINNHLPYAVRKEMPAFTTAEARVVVAAITQVWQMIAADIERASNEEAIEMCIDADRLRMFGQDEGHRLVATAFEQHGYAKVHKTLVQLVSLV